MKHLLAALMCLGLATLPGCGGGGGSDDGGSSPPPIADPGPGPAPDPGPDPGPAPSLAWVEQESGLNYGFIQSVSFPDAQHGWAIGHYDTFIRTQDGGATWTPFTHPAPGQNMNFQKIEFQDAFHGWIVPLARTVVFSTSDGGMTWTARHPAPSEYYESVSFVSATTGWIMGTQDEIYKTTDGGLTWTMQEVPTSFLSAIKFVDSQTGWILGGDPGPAPYAVLKTTDGGATWSTMHQIFGDLQLHDIDVAGDSAWVVGQVDGESPGPIVVGAYVAATSDGGATWSEQEVATTKGLRAVDFADESNGWTVGDRVYHTSNGGATWSAQPAPKNIYLDVAFVTATTGWVVGGDGVILKTTTGGEGAAPAPVPSGWSLQDAGTDSSIVAVSAVAADHAWILPNGGALLRTENGGTSWTSIGSPLAASQIQFFDTSNGWRRDSQNLYSTSDGGATWTVRRTGTYAGPGVPLLGVFSFISASTGWQAISAGNQLDRTTDGGATWTQLGAMPGGPTSALHFVNAQTGWRTAGRKVYKTTDGGATWTEQASVAGDFSTTLAAISAVGTTHAWVVGYQTSEAGGEIILATTNGGATWTEQHSDGSSGFSGVTFLDANTGWAIGKKIHRTTNGGATWTVQPTPEEGKIFGFGHYSDHVIVNSATAWVVGRDGIVLKTTTGGVAP